MIDLEEENKQLLLDQKVKEQRLLKEEEEKQKAKNALLSASWHQPDWIGDKPQSSSVIEYNIIPELVNISDDIECISVKIKDINDTADIAEVVAITKKCLPDNVTIGTRINPKTGHPEVYAEGKNLDCNDFEKKYSELSGGNFKFSGNTNDSLSAKDYENAKTHLTPKQQKAFVNNTVVASQLADKLDSGINSVEGIRAALDKETVKATLADAGATPIANDTMVVTSAPKPPQQQKISI